MAPNTKTCAKCKESLPASKFSRVSRDGGLRSRCNRCRGEDNKNSPNWSRERERLRYREKSDLRKRENPDFYREVGLRAKYGMTPQDYDTLLAMQGGVCALCSTPDPRGKHSRFHVDHCHETGRIRGLLCNGCNTALGKLGDDAEGIMRAYNYVTANADALQQARLLQVQVRQ